MPLINTSVSTLAAHLQLNSSVRSLQRSLMDAQKELSSGVKADLVAALRDRAAEDVDLRNALNDSAEFKGTTELVASRMDMMQTALGGVREMASQMRNTALTSRDSVSRGYLQEAAATAIDRINSFLNAQMGGRTLFAGIRTDMAPMQPGTTVNTATGYSPQQAVSQVITNLGPIVDAASAVAVANGADGVSAIFDDSNSDPNLRYSTTFYNGATTGTVTARLDRGYEIDYGVRADDPAMRELLQGLYMLASVPYGSVPEDAFLAWQDEAVAHINAGFQGVIDLSAELGYKQSVVNDAITQHEATIVQLNNQVATLEAADPFETALRLSQLQTQLEATFSLTARMSELSLTKFL
jgi:flagellar hook-associated protein 3 FlgL